jgi:hypothetical protein
MTAIFSLSFIVNFPERHIGQRGREIKEEGPAAAHEIDGLTKNKKVESVGSGKNQRQGKVERARRRLREDNSEGAPFAGSTQDFNPSAVFFYNVVDDEQPETGAVRSLGREELAEEFFTGGVVHSDSVVFDLKHD